MDADELLKGYLGGSIPEPKGTSSAVSGDDLIKSYLDTTKSAPIPAGVKRVPIVSAPISDVSKEDSDRINAEFETNKIMGDKNPRRYSSPSSLVGDLLAGASEIPGDIYTATGEAAKGGIAAIKQAGADFKENRPASAVGNAALGALQYVTSPFSGVTKTLVEEPVINLTGSKSAGEKAGLLSSFALPVAPAAKAISAARPAKKALNDFVDAIGGVDAIPKFLKEYASNPRLAAMDVSPSLLQTTQKLAVTPGEHQGLLSNIVEQRLGSAKGAVGSAIDSAMGAPVNVLEKVNELTNKAKSVGSQKINPILKQTNAVDVTPAIQHIDSILKPGVNSVVSSGTELANTKVKQALAETRRFLTDGKSNRTGAEDLHIIQSNLGNTAYTLSKSASGEDRMVGNALNKVKEKIVDAIDAAGPAKGDYRKARAEFSDARHISDAFDKGEEILKNAKRSDRPEYWDDWVKKAKPGQLEAAREGARIAIDKQINGMRNAVGQKGTEIPQVEFNKEKLRLLFDKKEVDEMFVKLQHERKIADTNKKLFEGSQTAMRGEADSRVAKRTNAGLESSSLLPYIAEGVAAYSTGLPGIGAAAYTAANMAKKHIANPLINRAADAKNMELARLASATGVDKDELIKQLSAMVTPVKPSMLSRAKLALPVSRP